MGGVGRWVVWCVCGWVGGWEGLAAWGLVVGVGWGGLGGSKTIFTFISLLLCWVRAGGGRGARRHKSLVVRGSENSILAARHDTLGREKRIPST